MLCVQLSKLTCQVVFASKDSGPLKYFLRIEVACDSQGLFLSHRKYSLEIIEECALLGVNAIDFPMETNHKLRLATGKHLYDPTIYRRLVGRLIYLIIIHPKLSYNLHILS